MVIGQARGRVFVVWDGVDGNPNPTDPDVPVTPGVNYDGLGGVDFSIYDALEILIAFSDLGGPINFTFWDADTPDGTNFARTTFNIPGGIEVDPPDPPVLFSNAFNTTNFTVTGTASLMEILDSVGAIQMEIDGTLSSGWDMNVDLVRVVGQQEVPPESVPEPSTVISLLALGGLSFALKRKGSKKR